MTQSKRKPDVLFPAKLTLLALFSAMAAQPAAAESKGAFKMFDTQIAATAQDQDPFFVGRWTPSPKSANFLVPRLDTSTVGDYASLAQDSEFGVARTRNGVLVSLEEWRRDRENVELAHDISGDALSTYVAKLRGDDPDKIAPLFFMETDPDQNLWTQVEVDATAGDSRFIRLRMVNDLRSDGLAPVAEMVRQYKDKKTEYTYHMNGKLAQLTTYDRATGFQPNVRVIDTD